MYKSVIIFIVSLIVFGVTACSNSSKTPKGSTSTDKLPTQQKKKKKTELVLDYDENSMGIYNYHFVEGLAAVRKSKKWGYIDKYGNTVIPFNYDDAYDFSEGLAAVKLNGKWGFVDKFSKLIIPLIYDMVSNFKEGSACVRKDGNAGVIDKTGDIIIPIEYDDIDFKGFSDGLIYASKDRKGGFLDKRGRTIIPFNYTSYDINARFYNGLAVVHDSSGYYIIDKRGNIKYQCSYPYNISVGIEGCSEGLFLLFDHEIGKVGYIDQDGDIKVPLEYQSMFSNFSEGYAAVAKDGKWGYIDKNGNVEVAFFFDWTCAFKNGLALVEKSKKWGYIDKGGEIIINFDYESLGEFSEEGLAKALKDGKWGFIDKNEDIVIPFIYDKVSSFSEGLAFVEIDGKTFLIDSSGKEI